MEKDKKNLKLTITAIENRGLSNGVVAIKAAVGCCCCTCTCTTCA